MIRALIFLLLIECSVNGQSSGVFSNFFYRNIAGTTSVYRYVGPGGVVSVPSSVNGLLVNEVGGSSGVPFLQDSNNITITVPVGLIIPNTVTNVTSLGCLKLTNVVLPNGLKSIPSNLFTGATDLKNVTMPSSITNIGGAAFSGCSGLTSLILPQNLKDINAYAFSGCSNLTNIILPDGLTNIGPWAFSNCEKLKSIVFPKTLVSISSSLFSSSTNLRAVYFLGNFPSSIDSSSIPLNTIVYRMPGKTGWETNNLFSTKVILPSVNSSSLTTQGNQANFQLKFTSIQGVTYQIQKTQNLIDWSTFQNINGDGNEQTVQDVAVDKSFYRILQN